MVGREETPKKSLELYRMRVYNQGHEENEVVLENGKTSRGSFKEKEVLKVLADKGRLPVTEYVRCKVRYFCDGAVFGSREFVNEIFREHRERFGAKRQSGARRIKGVVSEFYALRDLQVKVFG